ncbi:MAG: class I SAM-dependent methyltransferase [Pyrinomonadaceae bacterium]
MTQLAPQVDLQPVWQLMTAFQLSAAFKAAVEIELFTKIAEGNKTAATIGSACGASERGVRILADTLTVVGMLKKTNGEYGLTDVSAFFLDKRSPAYMGSCVEFIMDPTQMRGFNDLTNAVRQGGTTVTGDGSVDPESPMWVTFARAMAPLMNPSAEAIAANLGFATDRRLKVLDIAAGHGIFGITVAKHFPNAEIHAVDWPNVLTVATENAEKFGVSDRHHLIPGSAFDVDFGESYDVVLVTNFLHHFDAETCSTFMKKVNDALAPDGKAVTLEFIPNDDRVSPPAEALFPLVMLAATPAGDAYTLAELRTMFEKAGFSRNEHIPLSPMPQHLVISTK